MSAYVLSEDTDLDLDDICEYIGQDNIDAADRWIGARDVPSFLQRRLAHYKDGWREFQAERR